MIRTLIVDDEPDLRLVLRLAFEHRNEGLYVTGEAGAGEEALERLDEADPQIVVLDHMMPGMDGFETCRRLKAQAETRHIPVVLVTALDGRQDRIRGLEAGADEYVMKPFDRETLHIKLQLVGVA